MAVSSAGLIPAAVHYSPASAVSSQSIVRHDAPVVAAKLAVAAPLAFHAPAPVAYHAVSAPIAYHAAPIAKVIAQPEEVVSFKIIWVKKIT